jgi:hypothetical protein
LNDTTTYDSITRPDGRHAYLEYVGMAGFDINSGVWNMALPPFPGGDPLALTPALVYPGFPSVSTILFRQWARNTPWADSANAFRYYYNNKDWDSVAAERLGFVFSQPWGSPAWVNMLATHGLTPDSLPDFFSGNSQQMPPLATFIPDTAALRILGEWAKYYRSNLVPGGINASRKLAVHGGPSIRNRTLFVPKDWTGKAQMLDIRGRVFTLKPTGPGAYALPPQAPAGVYFFKLGAHYFKASML